MRYSCSLSLPCLSSGYDSMIFRINICLGSWNQSLSEICMLVFELVYPSLFHSVPMQEWATCYWNFPSMTPECASFVWKIIAVFSMIISSFGLTIKDKFKAVLGSVLDHLHHFALCETFLDNSSQAYPFLRPQLLNFALSCSLAPSNWLMLLLSTNCAWVGPHW